MRPQHGQLDISRFFMDLCIVPCVLDKVCFKVSCERRTVAFLCVFPLLSALLLLQKPASIGSSFLK